MKKDKLVLMVALCLFFIPCLAGAGDFDGSKPLICVPLETFECQPGQDCQGGTAESIDIPQFLKIDFKNNAITGTKQDGTPRTAKIEEKEYKEGKLILQGAQNGRGWSMVIAEGSGKMTLTASDDQVGFVVFGACMAR
jgi:hypothetical protein